MLIIRYAGVTAAWDAQGDWDWVSKDLELAALLNRSFVQFVKPLFTMTTVMESKGFEGVVWKETQKFFPGIKLISMTRVPFVEPPGAVT